MKCPNSYPIPFMKVLNYNVTDPLVLQIFSYSNVGNILFEPTEISGKEMGQFARIQAVCLILNKAYL